MTEAEFDTPLDFSAPLRVGCLGLGTACVVVLDETYPIVDFLHNSCRFFAHESCGQCTPCREGTHWALQMLERIKAGRGTAAGPRSAAGDRRGDRHHPRHDDLRPGRRRRLAHQDRDPQVPRRTGRVHPANEPARLPGHRAGRSPAGGHTEVTLRRRIRRTTVMLSITYACPWQRVPPPQSAPAAWSGGRPKKVPAPRLS